MQEKNLRENKKKSENNRRKRSILAYGLGTLGLVLLVTAAFFGPQIVFAMQDDIRCSAVVSMSPEAVDITSFNTGYETDLYKRLERFAKGLAEGREYYVTVQDMELTTEIADWMASEQGYYQEGFQVLRWNLGLIPDEVFDFNLISWKRCVIYGDDFAGGVNFILWYIELGNNDKPAARLLVDGETGEIYGVRTNFDAYFEDEYIQDTLVKAYDIFDDDMWDLSIILGITYGGLKTADMLNWLASIGIDYYPVDGITYIAVSTEYEEYEAYLREKEIMAANAGKLPDTDWVNRYSVDEIRDFLQRLQWRVSEDENCLDFDFPYEDSSLDFRIQLDGKIRWFKKRDNGYIDLIFGFPEIYEKIPAFMEDWS
ncbi:MAG: hypothetical protein K2J60_06080 [Acetatifactor sp.]|nr:hypothetical protein [Acetatifactor sp.]